MTATRNFTEEELERWGTYFRYFYFYEEMTFEEFLKRVDYGIVPKRISIDWDKVGAVDATDSNNGS